MIQAVYHRSLVLAVVALGGAGWQLVIGVVRLFEALSWGILLAPIISLGLGMCGLTCLVRYRPKGRLDDHGMRISGPAGWELAWDEMQAARLTPAELVLQPTAEARERESIRTAAFWSRVCAPGKHPRGAIVLPKPRFDADAWQILRDRGVATGGGAVDGPGWR